MERKTRKRFENMQRMRNTPVPLPGIRRSSRIAVFMALFMTIFLLNIAVALAQVQSHRLSEIRNIDTNLEMNVYQVNASYVNGTYGIFGGVGVGTATPGATLDVENAGGGAATIGGSLNTATGDFAVAMGDNTEASGNYATAMGLETIANNSQSTAIGYQSEASGGSSFAAGYRPKANGTVGVALGDTTLASGHASVALVSNSNATGYNSAAIGYRAVAAGNRAVALGYDTYSGGQASTAMGQGTNASGGAAVAMGWLTKALGPYTTAMGVGSVAVGSYATAIGYYTNASGDYSTAVGHTIESGGDHSFGVGLDTNYYNVSQANTMAVMGGDVGIGTTDPEYKLHVNTSSEDGIYSYCESGSCVAIRANSTGGTAAIEASYDWNAPASIVSNAAIVGLVPNFGGTYYAVYGRAAGSGEDYTGCIGCPSYGAVYGEYDGNNWAKIGQPGYGLQVKGSTYAGYFEGAGHFNENVSIGLYSAETHMLTVNNSDSDDVLRLIGPDSFGSGARINFGDGDYVYIDEYADDELRIWADSVLRVAGWDTYLGDGSGDAYLMTVGSGDLQVDGAGMLYITSDRTFKENISPIDDALEKTLKLEGVRFDWKDDLHGNQTEIGFIANDVYEVVPEITGQDGEYKTMFYGRTSALLVEAIKELKAEKDAEIAELKQIVCLDHPEADICQEG